MPGSRLAATTPSAIVRSTRAGAPSARASGGMRTRERAIRTAPKLTTFSPKAQARPPAVMTSPARAGPTTRPRLNWAAPRLIAPSRSSVPTRSGVMAWRAGMATAKAHPASSTIVATAATDSRSVAASRVSTAASRVWNRVTPTRKRRRSKRSASAPPNGPRSTVGT